MTMRTGRPRKEDWPGREGREVGKWGAVCGIHFLALLVLGAGCREDGHGQEAGRPQTFVGFVGVGNEDPLWGVLCAGAERFLGQTSGMNVRFEAPQRRSPSKQNMLIRRLLDEGMTAMCVQVEDPELIFPALVQAYKRGLPIFTMVRDAAPSHRTAFIGIDEDQVGRVLAETTLNSIDGKGTVAVIHAGFDHPLYGRRYVVFDRIMGTQSRIQVLKRMHCNAEPRKADRMLRDVLARYPNSKAVVLMANWPFQMKSAKPFSVPDTCRVISAGATPEYWEYLENGPCFALVGAEYGKIGFDAMLRCSTAGYQGAEEHRLEFEHVPTRVVWATTLAKFKLDWFAWASGPFRADQALDSQAPPHE